MSSVDHHIIEVTMD